MKFNFVPRSPRPVYALTLLALLSAAVVLLTVSCGSPAPWSPTATPTLTLTPTFPPTLTPTPLPLGSPGNPYVIGLVSENEDPQVSAAAGELAQRVSEAAGVSVTGKVFLTYRQLVEAQQEGSVHISWMPPLTYLYAHDQGVANVVLLTNHFGVYQYGAQFMANISRGFTPYYDPISGLNSADAATALAQFYGTRPCWVEPQSASGYILPAGLMRANNILTQPGVQAQTHTAVVRALYIKGICDFGVTFSHSGDPRTASTVQEDLPDVMDRVLIIWRTDPVIPNISLTLHSLLSEEESQMMTKIFLEIGSTPEGKALLSLSAGNYQIEDLRAINDDVFVPLRDAVTALNVDLRQTIGK